MTYSLRPYQADAVNAIWSRIRSGSSNALAILPTGAGKSLVLSQLAKDVVGWNGRVVMLSHVKELVSQVAQHIRTISPEVPVGVYSAGLKSRDLGYPVTVAGIQSAVNAAEDFGPVDVVCIDEVHRVPPDGEGQYRTFIEAAKRLNPNVCLIGLTATPYRMTSGMICGKDQLFDRICFEIGVRELIVKGFLSPLKSKATTQRTDLSNVSIRGGEYAQGELQAAMTGDEGKVVMACSEIAGKTDERKSVLVFCTGIDHANMVARFLQDLAGEDQVRTVFGDTPDDLRAEAIASFKRGAVKFLVNVDVLTTGFDAPAVDAVAILRPTLSPGLFYQMVGRGFRLADGKKDCLVLDFGDNLFRHGPVDRMVITEDKKTGQVGNSGARFKECPKCSEVLPWSCEICLECGEKLPKAEAEVKHGDIAADRDALSGPEKVLTTVYQKHEKDKDGRKSVTLRVNYDCGLMWPVSEFLCFEHPPGFARNKALEWWRARSSEPVPSTIDQALETIRTKGIKEPSQLVLKSEGKYLRVEKYIDMTFKPDPNVWLGEKTQPVDDKAFTNIPF